MFIFNTTFSIRGSRVAEWQAWMNESYLPEVGALMVTNGVEVFEVMTAEQDDYRTFSVQWRCMIPDHLEVINQVTGEIHNRTQSKFGEDCLHFSTILKEHKLDD